MSELPATVTPEIANHVAHRFDPGAGYPAGSFVSSLLDTISAADPSNRALLGLGFPGYVAAMTACMDDPDGIAQVLARSSEW